MLMLGGRRERTAASWITLRVQAKRAHVRLGFDRRVRLEFHGSKISSDGGLLLFRELDEVLGLHDIAGGVLRDTRTGHNRLHSLVGLCASRSSVGWPDMRM
jgi:hypothetical protein